MPRSREDLIASGVLTAEEAARSSVILIPDGTEVTDLGNGAIGIPNVGAVTFANPADAARFLREPSADAYEFRVQGYAQLSVNPPASNVRLTAAPARVEHICFDRETCHSGCPAFAGWSAVQRALAVIRDFETDRTDGATMTRLLAADQAIAQRNGYGDHFDEAIFYGMHARLPKALVEQARREKLPKLTAWERMDALDFAAE